MMGTLVVKGLSTKVNWRFYDMVRFYQVFNNVLIKFLWHINLIMINNVNIFIKYESLKRDKNFTDNLRK